MILDFHVYIILQHRINDHPLQISCNLQNPFEIPDSSLRSQTFQQRTIHVATNPTVRRYIFRDNVALLEKPPLPSFEDNFLTFRSCPTAQTSGNTEDVHVQTDRIPLEQQLDFSLSLWSTEKIYHWMDINMERGLLGPANLYGCTL